MTNGMYVRPRKWYGVHYQAVTISPRPEAVRFHLQSESGVVVPQQMMIRDAGDCHQLAALPIST